MSLVPHACRRLAVRVHDERHRPCALSAPTARSELTTSLFDLCSMTFSSVMLGYSALHRCKTRLAADPAILFGLETEGTRHAAHDVHK
jgi:hypothetical protein